MFYTILKRFYSLPGVEFDAGQILVLQDLEDVEVLKVGGAHGVPHGLTLGVPVNGPLNNQILMFSQNWFNFHFLSRN